MKRRERWLLTSENWYPNWEGGKVKASFLRLRDGTYRVCVWGEDDFGMEKDFTDRDTAEHVFERLPHIIFKADLKALGFVRA